MGQVKESPQDFVLANLQVDLISLIRLASYASAAALSLCMASLGRTSSVPLKLSATCSGFSPPARTLVTSGWFEDHATQTWGRDTPNSLATKSSSLIKPTRAGPSST